MCTSATQHTLFATQRQSNATHLVEERVYPLDETHPILELHNTQVLISRISFNDKDEHNFLFRTTDFAETTMESITQHAEMYRNYHWYE